MKCSICGGPHIPVGNNSECIDWFQNRVNENDVVIFMQVKKLTMLQTKLKYKNALIAELKRKKRKRCT
jgi:hypothetical protein